MSEPAVDVETTRDVWETHTVWPIPGTVMTDVFLQSGATNAAQGVLGGSSAGALDTLTFTDANLSENNYLSLTNSQNNKRTFISAPLKAPLRISGTPIVEIEAALSKTQLYLSAFLVDYGRAGDDPQQRRRYGDSTVARCWGASVAVDTRCFIDVIKPQQNVTQWRVTKGMMDWSNRNSLLTAAASPVTIGQRYRFGWDAAGGLHVRGRPPDRDHHRRQLLGLRFDERHDPDGRHAGREAVEDEAADRRRLRRGGRRGRVLRRDGAADDRRRAGHHGGHGGGRARP